MKAILFKVIERDNCSFHVQDNEREHQYNDFHYHPEYQISLIASGSGVASIGNAIDHFEQGDIYLIGPNVPHVFKHDAVNNRNGDQEEARMISIFFKENSFGNRFFFLPEMAKVRELLQGASRGIKLYERLAEKIIPVIHQLNKASGATRLVHLLDLLDQMAVSSQRRFLASEYYGEPQKADYYHPMSKIFDYISENFDKQISLEEVAGVANLSKYAFCRYFKRITNKSFITYLNEFRTGIACKYLLTDSYSIAQVGFLAGFNNLSNFNRQFKKIMKCTPSRYRDLYKKYFDHKSA